MKVNISNIIDTIKGFMVIHKTAVIATAAVVCVTGVGTGIALSVARDDNTPNNTQPGTTIVDNVSRETFESEPGFVDTSETETEEITVSTKEAETISSETDETEVVTDTSAETTKTSKETTEPESQPDWLGAPEVIPETTTTTTTQPQTQEPKPTNPDDKEGSTDPLTGKPITIIRTKEGYDGLGRKYIRYYYSDGTSRDIVECEYCHEMPCPHGGGTSCPKYDVKKDASITCPQCGKRMGDGYNGTCYGEIDWANGGKKTCHHYS